MRFQCFASVIALLCLTGCSRSASIADMVTVEEVHTPEGVVAVPENSDVVEAEDGKMAQEEDVPYEVRSVHEDDILPVVSEAENCEKPDVVVEEQLIERAERQADEDLLKAIDNVLTKKETIGDVIKSEEIAV